MKPTHIDNFGEARPVNVYSIATGKLIHSCESLKRAAIILFLNPQKAKNIGEHCKLLRKKLKPNPKTGIEEVYVRFA